MIITSDWLKSKDASQYQYLYEDFRSEWPDGCEANRQNLERVAALDIDLKWLAEKVLSATGCAEYKAKRDPLEFKAMIVILKPDYMEKLAPILADFKAKVNPIHTKCQKDLALIKADYRAHLAQSDDLVKCATMFVELQAKQVLIDAECKEKIHPMMVEFKANHDLLETDYMEKCDLLAADCRAKIHALTLDTLVDFFGQDNTQGKM